MKFHLWPAELREQLDRAMRLEEERRRAEQEAARLEAERMEAIIAREELERQTEHQIRSQEQLVCAGVSIQQKKKSTHSTPFHVTSFVFCFLLVLRFWLSLRKFQRDFSQSRELILGRA